MLMYAGTYRCCVPPSLKLRRISCFAVSVGFTLRSAEHAKQDSGEGAYTCHALNCGFELRELHEALFRAQTDLRCLYVQDGGRGKALPERSCEISDRQPVEIDTLKEHNVLAVVLCVDFLETQGVPEPAMALIQLLVCRCCQG